MFSHSSGRASLQAISSSSDRLCNFRIPGANHQFTMNRLLCDSYVHVAFGGAAVIVDDTNQMAPGVAGRQGNGPSATGRMPIRALPSNQKTRRTSAATPASSAMVCCGADCRKA